MRSAKVTTKGQVTIPSAIRRKLGLEKGDRVQFLDDGDRVYLQRREHRIEAAFGLCQARQGATLKEIEQAIERGATE